MRVLNHAFWYAATPLFFAVMGLSVWGLLWTDTPFNAPFIWAWRYLALPILAICWLYAYTQRRYFLEERRVGPGQFWFSVLAVPPIALLMSGGIVSLLNASFPTDETVTYHGPIKELFITRGGRHTGHEVRIRDEATASIVTLDVGADEYASLHVGQAYARTFRVGWLGIPFRDMKERL